MFTIKNSRKENLPDLVECHMQCFPNSLATKLGRSYVKKTLEWFLVDNNRFLYHIGEDGKPAGYCGGFMPVKPGDGSSSGMLQHAFREAIWGIARNPLLLFHPEVRVHYPFLWFNIKRKITGKVKPMQPVAKTAPFKPYVGLVVIGVIPVYRGRGLAQTLLQEFEWRTQQFQQKEMVLSVKKDNAGAIKAYSKVGWSIREEHDQTYVMHKLLAEI